MDDQILDMLREELKNIRKGQEAIHTRIDSIHTEIRESQDKIDKQIAKGFTLVNGRMRKLEGWRNRIVGALTILTIFGSAFVGWIINYLPM